MQTIKELQKLKSDWYEEAKINGNLSNLHTICKYLGERISHNYGPKYQFSDGDLKLYVDDYGNYLTLRKDDKLVCSTHSDRLFIKSICEPFIELHIARANAIKSELEESQNQSELSKLRKELMLD